MTTPSPDRVERPRRPAVRVWLLLGTAAWAGCGGQPSSEPPTPTPTPRTATAHFISIEGSVKIRRVGTFTWVRADLHMALRKNDLIRTEPGSSAQIKFPDGTVIHVRPKSLITIEVSDQEPDPLRAASAAVGVTSGYINYQSFGTTELSTATLTLVQEGEGTGSIGVRDSGESDVTVYGGQPARVDVKGGGTITLAANERVSVDATGQAGAKVTLPPAPQLLTPADETSMAYRNPERTPTPLTWARVEGAAAYRVMLDRTPLFNQPLKDLRDVRRASTELRGLPEGRYFWRVAAVAASGVEGAYSNAARFEITRAPYVPPVIPELSLEELHVHGNILRLKGRVGPGAHVKVNKQPIEVQPDGSFYEDIPLPASGRQEVTIQAIGPDGGVKTERRTVVVGG